MMFTRRRILFSAVAGATLAQGIGLPVAARADDQTRAERSLGRADAKYTVNEYFSLSCSHCAAFAAETMPKVKTDFIATGKVRWIFNDYPLDQVSLLAAQVARYLPVDRYTPFVEVLFASQDRWAFARDANHTEELWKTAGLAGMNRATFDKAVADNDLRNWIVEQRQIATDKWKVDSTPSFVINGTKYAGEMTFDAFRKLVPDS